MNDPVVRLESCGRGAHDRSYRFDGFRYAIEANEPDAVMPALEQVEAAAGEGLHAAGFVTYEAASGLDPAFRTARKVDGLPLVWFGVFDRRVADDPDETLPDSVASMHWRPSIDRDQYDRDISRIRNYIAAGDTYQVNYTFRMTARCEDDPLSLYRALCRSQRADYCAYVDTGSHQILSASPELFFALENGRLTTRPMKGTHRRGRWSAEDEQFAHDLARSEKNRAENLMIVDLLRNDLGRVSRTGSVEVSDLWSVEPYETLFQMTSTVEGDVADGVGIPELFEALFPCGSVTGAPKVRTMEIISKIEAGPRGVYTGAIGYVSPGSEAVFNVAIRTVCVDRSTRQAVFGVGGGITWDSTSDDEYRECVTKARVLTERRPDFDLFETIRVDDGAAFLRERHVDRLARSAEYFGYEYEAARIEAAVAETCAAIEGTGRLKVVLAKDGSVRCESGELTPTFDYTATVSPVRVNSSDVFLYHKTTHRDIYDRCRAACPDVDDVILVNERDELTEFTIGNLVLEIDGRRLTPPVSAGLLPGTFREELLQRGDIEEATLRLCNLEAADHVYLVNSVREWVPVAVTDRAPLHVQS